MSATTTLARLLAALAVVAAASAFLRRPRGLKHTKPEMWMDSVKLSQRQGFPMETHSTVTPDGYRLVLHRIASSRNGTRGDMPVLLGHGLCSSDEQWLTRDNGLVFQLADRGFDVWLANYRGSFYSQKHKKLTVKDHDFWDFSWHENGVIDQAESIDYVLRETGKEELIVLGHSMSSTAQVVLLAERPEYNKKVRAQVLLAPPAHFKHPTGFMAYSALMINRIPFGRASNTEFVENDKFPGTDRPFPQACYKDYGGPKPVIKDHFMRILNFVMGNLHQPVDKDQLEILVHHYPAGSSIRQVMHYAQLILSGKFAKYDFGKDRNKELYGQATPPDYNLTNINVPTYIMYSPGDGNVNWRDAEEFARALPPGVLRELHKIPVADFCHIDYLIMRDAQELVYKFIIEYMEEIRDPSFKKYKRADLPSL